MRHGLRTGFWTTPRQGEARCASFRRRRNRCLPPPVLELLGAQGKRTEQQQKGRGGSTRRRSWRMEAAASEVPSLDQNKGAQFLHSLISTPFLPASPRISHVSSLPPSSDKLFQSFQVHLAMISPPASLDRCTSGRRPSVLILGLRRIGSSPASESSSRLLGLINPSGPGVQRDDAAIKAAIAELEELRAPLGDKALR